MQNLWCFLVSLGFLGAILWIQGVFWVSWDIELVSWLVFLVGLWSISKIPVSSVVWSMVWLVTMLCVLWYSDSIVFAVWGICMGAFVTFAFFEYFPHQKLPQSLQKFSPEEKIYPIFHKVVLGIYILLLLVGVALFLYSYEISTWMQTSHSAFVLLILVHFIGVFLLILLSKYPWAIFWQIGGIWLVIVCVVVWEQKFWYVSLFGWSDMEVFSVVLLPLGMVVWIGVWIGMTEILKKRKKKNILIDEEGGFEKQ